MNLHIRLKKNFFSFWSSKFLGLKWLGFIAVPWHIRGRNGTHPHWIYHAKELFVLTNFSSSGISWNFGITNLWVSGTYRVSVKKAIWRNPRNFLNFCHYHTFSISYEMRSHRNYIIWSTLLHGLCVAEIVKMQFYVFLKFFEEFQVIIFGTLQ